MHTEHANPVSYPTLVDLLRWRGTHQPDRLAFTFLRDGEDDEDHITYQALDRRARAVGALLQRQVPPGGRAVLLYPSGLDYITAFLGCLYAGVIAVPAYPPKPRLERTLHRLRAITADAGPAVFLTTNSILPIAEPLAAREPGFAEIQWLATDTAADAEGQAWREPVIGADTLAFLQYTSGSTTAPRGVMVSHGNLMHNEALIKGVVGADGDSLAVSWLPMYHDMGLIGMVLQPLYAGFRCVLMSPAHFLANPVRWLRTITRCRATLSAAPNFAYDLCAAQITADERASLDLSSWKAAVNGAEPVRPETLSGFTTTFGPCGLRPEVFAPCYGLAEATLLVSGGPVADRPVVVQAEKAALRRGQVTVSPARATERTSALAGCGQLQPEQRLLVVDPGTRRPCRPGEVGEIWVSGPSVACGYWNSPCATERTFRARLADGEGPYLRTGDLGFVHGGQLFVTSRLKDLIIIRGCNHAPQDIERTAQASHPVLRPGCGIAFTVDDGAEPRLVIVHEVKRQYLSVDCEEVAAAIRSAVSEEHELDVHAVVLVRTGTIPKTSSGKLQRQACRNEFVRGTLRKIGESVRAVREQAPPESLDRSDAVLAELIESAPDRRLPVLVTYLRRELATAAGVPIRQVPAARPFTALGLDSLRLLQLKQRVETELGVAVPLDSFIDYPSPAELATPVLEALDQKISAIWAELAGLTDEQAGERLAQFTAKEIGQ